MTTRNHGLERPRLADRAVDSKGQGGAIIPRGWIASIAVGVALLASWAFSPVLENGFVDIDDRANFLENREFRGLGWSQVVHAFTTPRIAVYQPLNSLLASVIHEHSGLDPSAYHAVSLTLHSLNAVLLFLVVLALVGRRDPVLARANPKGLAIAAGLAVSWYAAHPQRAEAVAWATAQLYLSATTFALLAILAYLRAFPVEGGPARSRGLSISYALSVASMLCMPGAVVLPFVFLILDAAVLGRFDGPDGSAGARARRWGRGVLEKLPIVVPAVALMIVAYLAKRAGRTAAAPELDGLWGRLAQVAYGVWLYLGKAVAPIGLSPFYPRPERGDFRAPVFLGAVVGLIAASLLVMVARRKVRWLPWVWGAYLLILLPHLGLIPVGKTIAADRYTYLATVVWVAPIAAGMACLGRRLPTARVQTVAVVAGVAVAVGLAGLSRVQSRIWHDPQTLWSRALACAPASSQVHALLGTALSESGQPVKALAEFDRALAIGGDDAETLVKRGATLAALGRLDEAEASDRKALALNPSLPLASLNLGIVESLRGRNAEAIALYRRALEFSPKWLPALVKLGIAELQGGDAAGAETTLRTALELSPEDIEARATLGASLAMQGQGDAAMTEYDQVLRSDPNHVPTLVNLGMALAKAGQLDQAVDPLARAVALDPANADAHHALGVILAGRGRMAEAAAEFDQALRIRPDHPQAKVLLGMVRQQLGATAAMTR